MENGKLTMENLMVDPEKMQARLAEMGNTLKSLVEEKFMLEAENIADFWLNARRRTIVTFNGVGFDFEGGLVSSGAFKRDSIEAHRHPPATRSQILSPRSPIA